MKTLALVILSLIPWLSRAEECHEFVAASKVIVKTLRSQGVKQVGEINLKLLAKEISKTKWDCLIDGFAEGSGDDRATSVYLSKERKVTINRLALKKVDTSLFPKQALHEALGANGYDDENYQLTLSLDYIAKQIVFARELFEKKLENIGARFRDNKIYENVGGGTSVGGGGDLTALEFKSRLMKMALDVAEHQPERLAGLDANQFLNQILESSIEPNWDFSELSKLFYGIKNGRIKVIIPSMLWHFDGEDKENGDAQKNQIVALVFDKIVAELR